MITNPRPEPAFEEKPKKGFQRPDAYVLMFVIALIAAIASYIIPAGAFKRVAKGDITVVIPGSYHEIAQTPVSFIKFLSAIPEGMAASASIIFLVLFTGGTIAILEKTGAVNGLIHSVVDKFKTRQLLFIAAVGFLFSILGTTGIVVNSVIGFIPLGILVARALKWDAMVGAAVIYLGTYAGFNAQFLSPTPLGVSQKMAELPMFSGMGLRLINYLAFIAVTIGYLYFYTKKLKKTNKSPLGDDWFPGKGIAGMTDAMEKTPFTLRQKLILGVTALLLIIYVYGAFKLGWADNEMSAVFILIAILAGLIGRLKVNDIAKTFVGGCQNLVYGALIVGMARSISVVLTDGNLLDTIVNSLANLLHGLSPVSGAIGMYLLSAFLHFFISSGSGEAVVLVPILTPLADLMHITRQVAIQAVMVGEGVVNCFNPTSGVLMGVLAASGISYGKWVRFVLPLVGMWFVIGLIIIVIGVATGWGPH
ncbi:YfcC family protein [Peribacillus kribbensis]|uniref:YfcC family protein n=1 Tax=Peribacillus kribbensis TaxID=356658 RepID=UPI0004195323|nr:Na+/H+ antiporter NhaC family protein [Peribacillus kribbensis]